MNLTAEVVVNLVIDSAGKIRSATPEGKPDQDMISSTEDWKFIPVFKQARPVASRLQMGAYPQNKQNAVPALLDPSPVGKLIYAHQGCTPSAEREYPTFAFSLFLNPLSSRPLERTSGPKEGVSYVCPRTTRTPQLRTS